VALQGYTPCKGGAPCRGDPLVDHGYFYRQPAGLLAIGLDLAPELLNSMKGNPEGCGDFQLHASMRTCRHSISYEMRYDK